MTALARDELDLAVAVIDDHDAIHAAIRVWCEEASPSIGVVGSYTATAPFLREHPSRGDIDVVVFDLELGSRRPDFSGLQRICDAGHRVVVYSHLTADEMILRCMELGAVTYLVKSEGKRHLIDALRSAKTDEPYVGPRMGSALFNDVSVGRPNLARREKEVLLAWFQTESKDLVAQSCSSRMQQFEHTCSGSAPSTPQLAARRRRSLPWLPGPSRTASSAWTNSSCIRSTVAPGTLARVRTR